MIRTWQHAPYLEARRRTCASWSTSCWRAAGRTRLGRSEWTPCVTARVPLIAGLVKTELTTAGLCLAAAGLLVLALSRRPREAGLLRSAPSASSRSRRTWARTKTKGSCCRRSSRCGRSPARTAVGLRVLRARGRHARPASWRWVYQPGRGCRRRAADRQPAGRQLPHQRSSQPDVRDPLLRLAVRDAPDKSTIVRIATSVNMMVKYKLLGEQAAGSRHIAIATPVYESVSDTAAAGVPDVCVQRRAGEARDARLRVRPVQLYDVPLPAFLDVIGRTGRWRSRPRLTSRRSCGPTAAGWKRLGVSRGHALRAEGRRTARRRRRQRRGRGGDRVGRRSRRPGRRWREGCTDRHDRAWPAAADRRHAPTATRRSSS